MSDGLHPECISFSKKYCNENWDKTRIFYLEKRDNIKKYQLKNPDQINTRTNEYVKNHKNRC